MALDKQDVDLDAPLAAKELARAEALFQARRWASARQASYDRVRAVYRPAPIAIA